MNFSSKVVESTESLPSLSCSIPTRLRVLWPSESFATTEGSTLNSAGRSSA